MKGITNDFRIIAGEEKGMMKEKGAKFFFAVAGLLLFLYSCDRELVYTDSFIIPSATWPLEITPSFDALITDTTSLNDIFITIRTGSEYPFRNIWFFVTTTSPSGKMIIDTLEYMLSDMKGKRYGRGFANIKEVNLKFREGVYFPETGIYKFKIRHGMRAENLKGVYDIGLRIRKTGIKPG